MRVEDSETGEQTVIDAKNQSEQMRRHRENLQESMLQAGVNLLQIESGADCVDALTAYFHGRKRKKLNETGG